MNKSSDVDPGLIVSGKSIRRSKVKKSYLDSGPSQEQIDRRNFVKQQLRLGDDDDEEDYLKAQLGSYQQDDSPTPSAYEDCPPYCGGGKEASGFGRPGGLLGRKSITPRTSKNITSKLGRGADYDDGSANSNSDVTTTEKKRATNNRHILSVSDHNRNILSVSDHGLKGRRAEGFMGLEKAPQRNSSFGSYGGFTNTASSSWHARSHGIHDETRNSTSPSPSLKGRKPRNRDEIFEKHAPSRAKSMSLHSNRSERSSDLSLSHSHDDENNLTSESSHSTYGRKSGNRGEKVLQKSAPRRFNSAGALGSSRLGGNGHSHDDENNLTSVSSHSTHGRKWGNREEKVLQKSAPRRFNSLGALGSSRLGGSGRSPEMNPTKSTVPHRSYSRDDVNSIVRKSPTKSFSWGGKGLRPISRARGTDRSISHTFPFAPKLSGTDRDMIDADEATANSSCSGRSNVYPNSNSGKDVPPSILQKEDIYNNAVRRAHERQSHKREIQPSLNSTPRSSGHENRIFKPRTAKQCDDYGFVSPSDSEDDDIDSLNGFTKKSSGGPTSSEEPSIFQRGLMALEKIYDDLNV